MIQPLAGGGGGFRIAEQRGAEGQEGGVSQEAFGHEPPVALGQLPGMEHSGGGAAKDLHLARASSHLLQYGGMGEEGARRFAPGRAVGDEIGRLRLSPERRQRQKLHQGRIGGDPGAQGVPSRCAPP